MLNNEWAADSFYINPDDIAQKIFGDWNAPEAVLKAAEQATSLRYQYLEEQRDFVFETVFSSPEKLEFLHKAKAKGFFIRFFYVCTSDPTINVARITQRYMNGGHEVPISKIITRLLTVPMYMTTPLTTNFPVFCSVPGMETSSNVIPMMSLIGQRH